MRDTLSRNIVKLVARETCGYYPNNTDLTLEAMIELELVLLVQGGVFYPPNLKTFHALLKIKFKNGNLS